jgi:hypothetical protein
MWRAEGVHVSKTIVVAGLVFATAASLGAQQVRNEGLSAEAQIQQRRFQFQLMEGVLEAALRRTCEGQGLSIGWLWGGVRYRDSHHS